MYIITLILLIVYYHHKRLGLILILLLIIGNIFIHCLALYNLDINILYLNIRDPRFFEEVYYIPWYKIGPYLLGTLLGIFYSESLNNKDGFAYKIK